jgi:hypothetical protein
MEPKRSRITRWLVRGIVGTVLLSVVGGVICAYLAISSSVHAEKTLHAIKFYLQINEHPVGDVEAYAASVYAERYGIHTGWHRLELDDQRAVESLAPWLSRWQFTNRKWRREFRERHPECCVERFPRRGRWEPYFPDDPKPPP